MSSPFSHLPTFPESLASILPISYRKLLAGDRGEAAQVLEAAKRYGVPEGGALLTESEQLHALAKDAFAALVDEKLPFALQRGVSLFGYKATGTVKITDKDQLSGHDRVLQH